MEMHNQLGITPPIETVISQFYNRPYQVPKAARFADALHKAAQSDVV
jgi:hypothetical protein